MKSTTARFPGKCGLCATAFVVGETIVNPGNKWVHPACAGALSNPRKAKRHPRPLPWRGEMGQFSTATQKHRGYQPINRKNPPSQWHRASNNPRSQYMIPLEWPAEDYHWGKQPSVANWTSYPEYSYEQFYRENPRKARQNGSAKCMSCSGTGYSGPHGDTCSRCEGSGWISVEECDLCRKTVRGGTIQTSNGDWTCVSCHDAQEGIQRDRFGYPIRNKSRGRENPSAAQARAVPWKVPQNAGYPPDYVPAIFPYGQGGRPAEYTTTPKAKKNPLRTARRNMAGRPGKHGLPRYEGPRPAGLQKFSKAALKAMGSLEAMAELEWRRLDREMRFGMASPPARSAKRKPHGPQTTAFAPGFSAAPDVEKGQQVFRILLRGQALPSEKMPAGRYALNMERAAQLSHKLDPQTGERLRFGKKKAQRPGMKAAANPAKEREEIITCRGVLGPHMIRRGDLFGKVEGNLVCLRCYNESLEDLPQYGAPLEDA